VKTLDLIPQPEPLCYTPVSHPTEVPMRLIGLAVVLAVILTLALLAAGAQQTEKVRRIGFRSGTNPNYESTTPSFGRFSGASSDRATSEPHRPSACRGTGSRKPWQN
jgi:hypothetical protein